MFGAIKNAVIKSCIVSNMNIVGKDVIGGIVGYIDNTSKVYASKKESNIIVSSNNGSNFGGIAGVVRNNSEIEYSYNIGKTYGGNGIGFDVGGIVGISSNEKENENSIINCYNLGNIQGERTKTECLGGIIGGSRDSQNKNNSTKRLYGGNCSSLLKLNANGTVSAYDANLVMPSVYDIVNASNIDEFIVEENSFDSPKLKNIE